MRVLKRIISHISIALCLGLVVITILDGFNPMMSFLTSKPSKLYIYATCAFCVINGVITLIMLLTSSDCKKQ